MIRPGHFGALEVSRVDGKVLYRGPLTSGGSVQMHVPLAVNESRLVARLVGGASGTTIDVTGDAAEFNFRSAP